jgi:TetR/AcrR family transcriptional repressor of nem operon
MRVSQVEMNESHERIVAGASRLMRERGVQSTSVADAMNQAGMTHGGFYRHFKNKDDLVVEALRSAFGEFVNPLELRQTIESPQTVAQEYKSLYLSPEHVANPGFGCPMPALGSDLSRASETVKAEFSSGLKRVVEALEKSKDGTDVGRRQAAMREVAMLVGAVLIARATDSETAESVLAACRALPGCFLS